MTPSAARLLPEPLAAATAVLQRHVDAGQSAGVVAMLARDGKLAYVATVGVQDLATRAPMTERTLFRIYSMTKPVTAVAVMMLFKPPRTLKSPTTVIDFGVHAATRSSKIRFTTRS